MPIIVKCHKCGYVLFDNSGDPSSLPVLFDVSEQTNRRCPNCHNPFRSVDEALSEIKITGPKGNAGFYTPNKKRHNPTHHRGSWKRLRELIMREENSEETVYPY